MLVNKKQIHELINNCNNEILLSEVKDLLQTSDTNDWWEDLSTEDKNLVMESEIQYEKGNFITHDMLLQQFEEWKKK